MKNKNQIVKKETTRSDKSYDVIISIVMLLLVLFLIVSLIENHRLSENKSYICSSSVPEDRPGVWIGTDKPIAHVILDLSDPNQKSAAAQIQEYLRANKIGYYNTNLHLYDS